MTVLVRDELNDADLAWAVADQATAHVMAEALRIQAMLAPAAAVRTAPAQPEPSRPELDLARLALAAGFQ